MKKVLKKFSKESGDDFEKHSVYICEGAALVSLLRRYWRDVQIFELRFMRLIL